MLTNIPNLLTLSRIFAIPLIIFTFYIDAPYGNWIGLGVLAYAGVTDFFRRIRCPGHVTAICSWKISGPHS